MKKITAFVKLTSALGILVLALTTAPVPTATADTSVECSGSGNLCHSTSSGGITVENGPNEDGTYYKKITFSFD